MPSSSDLSRGDNRPPVTIEERVYAILTDLYRQHQLRHSDIKKITNRFGITGKGYNRIRQRFYREHHCHKERLGGDAVASSPSDRVSSARDNDNSTNNRISSDCNNDNNNRIPSTCDKGKAQPKTLDVHDSWSRMESTVPDCYIKQLPFRGKGKRGLWGFHTPDVAVNGFNDGKIHVFAHSLFWHESLVKSLKQYGWSDLLIDQLLHTLYLNGEIVHVGIRDPSAPETPNGPVLIESNGLWTLSYVKDHTPFQINGKPATAEFHLDAHGLSTRLSNIENEQKATRHYLGGLSANPLLTQVMASQMKILERLEALENQSNQSNHIFPQDTQPTENLFSEAQKASPKSTPAMGSNEPTANQAAPFSEKVRENVFDGTFCEKVPEGGASLPSSLSPDVSFLSKEASTPGALLDLGFPSQDEPQGSGSLPETSCEEVSSRTEDSDEEKLRQKNDDLVKRQMLEEMGIGGSPAPEKIAEPAPADRGWALAQAGSQPSGGYDPSNSIKTELSVNVTKVKQRPPHCPRLKPSGVNEAWLCSPRVTVFRNGEAVRDEAKFCCNDYENCPFHGDKI